MPPGHECQSNGGKTAIYATVDVMKKKKRAEPATTPPLPPPPSSSSSSSNYMNLEPVTASAAATNDGRKPPTDNYMNLEFSESLCHYENAKNVLTRAGLADEPANACDKCGHRKRCVENGDGKGDYMTMEPVVNGRLTEHDKRNQLYPGYLPMCPAANGCGGGGVNGNRSRDILKNMMNRGLAEKSASIPSLNEYCKTAGSGSVPVENKNLSRVTADAEQPRKRSSSTGSSEYECLGQLRSRSSGGCGALRGPAVAPTMPASAEHCFTSSAESVTSQIAKCPATDSAASDDGSAPSVRDDQQTALVHIRRSSSVPCKNNRDSSSSNDSGVSTGSIRYRGADFAEFELPLTTAMSAMRHRRTMAAAAAATGSADGTGTGGDDRGLAGGAAIGGCVHGSLPRRSKSTDRLKELNFRFQKFAGPMKSSSAGAEVPVCLKKDKGQYRRVCSLKLT